MAEWDSVPSYEGSPSNQVSAITNTMCHGNHEQAIGIIIKHRSPLV